MRSTYGKITYAYRNVHIVRIAYGRTLARCFCYRPIHLPQGWISQKRLKLGLCNFHCTVAPSEQFCRISFYTEILTCSPWPGASNNSGYGEQAIFWFYAPISRKRYKIHPKLLLMTNRKLHYALSIGTKIDDLGWPWIGISLNFLKNSRDLADMGGNNW